MADVSERAYAAGLFDGEGCIELYVRAHRTRCALSVSNTCLTPIEWLQAHWDGRILTAQRGRPRLLYVWHIEGPESEAFAHDILPFLKIRHDELLVWLKLRARIRPRGGNPVRLTDEERAIRRAIAHEFHDLHASRTVKATAGRRVS